MELTAFNSLRRGYHILPVLTWAMHFLFLALWLLAVVRSAELDDARRWFSLTCAVGLLSVYASGVFSRTVRTQPTAMVWVAAVTVLWTLLVLHVPDAAYLAFPLFFLYLHVLSPLLGSVAIISVAIISIVAIGLQQGWSTGGMAGPAVAALAALAVGAGYRSLADEARRRQQLIDELLATRAQLAAQERLAGAEAERTRLAGEIHDTIAQGLASIQMLLHATERSAPDHPQVDTIRLARETAGENLREARRVVQALRPGVLEGTSLTEALNKVAEHAPEKVAVHVHTDIGPEADIGVPMATAIVRIAQESVANAVQHGKATRVDISAQRTQNCLHLQIRDNGCGFDPAAPVADTSFGIANMRRRAAELGGSLRIDSDAQGTVIEVEIPWESQR